MTRLARLGSDFDEFVRQSSVDLLRLAVLLTRDRGEAQDLLQTALVRVAGRWPAARHNPRSYTRQVLVNLAKNRWRDKARRPHEARDLVGVEQAEDPADEHIVQRDAVSRLLAQLPMGQRKVLVLRYFEDLSVAEVAAVLGCSDGNVKSQANRALATLRQLLATQTAPTTTEELHAQR
jgi:RNA polymerase sigma-70 factor (sigma-E family)